MVDGLVNIWESGASVLVADQLVAEPGFVTVQPVLDQVCSAITGYVVNDNYFDFVCRVVKIVDRLQMIVISVPLCIVEGGCYDTEGQFFWLKGVLFIEPLLLTLHQLELLLLAIERLSEVEVQLLEGNLCLRVFFEPIYIAHPPLL